MRKILLIIFIFLFPGISVAHIEHYAHLNVIKFNIFFNDSKVGYHHIFFTRNKDNIIVNNKINFDIRKLGISFYKYISDGTEIYDQQGKLLSFNSKTSDNNTDKFCNIKKEANTYKIEGTKFNGYLDKDFLISSYWNHEILKKTIQVSGISCSIRNQKVTFIKNETIVVQGIPTESLVFDIQGDNLNTQVWFRKKDMAIVRQVLNRSGVWLYEIEELN